jgi:hypothetical protein
MRKCLRSFTLSNVLSKSKTGLANAELTLTKASEFRNSYLNALLTFEKS